MAKHKKAKTRKSGNGSRVKKPRKKIDRIYNKKGK